MDREQIRLTVRGGGPVAVWTNNWFAPPPAAKRSLKLQASMHLPLRAWKMRYRDVHSPKSPFPNPQFGNEGKRGGSVVVAGACGGFSADLGNGPPLSKVWPRGKSAKAPIRFCPVGFDFPDLTRMALT